VIGLRLFIVLRGSLAPGNRACGATEVWPRFGRGNPRLTGLVSSLRLRSPGDNTRTYGSGTDVGPQARSGENVMFMELTEGNIEAGDRIEPSSQPVRFALPWRPKTTATSRTAGSQPQPPTPGLVESCDALLA